MLVGVQISASRPCSNVFCQMGVLEWTGVQERSVHRVPCTTL